jgi:hypothetical protein
MHSNSPWRINWDPANSGLSANSNIVFRNNAGLNPVGVIAYPFANEKSITPMNQLAKLPCSSVPFPSQD